MEPIIDGQNPEHRARLRLDPWRTGFADEFASARPVANIELELDVERAPGSWGPMVPVETLAEPRHLIFVDGVRRVEARCTFDTPNGESAAGIFASFAFGTAEIVERQAQIVQQHVRRRLLLIGQTVGDEYLPKKPSFEVQSVAPPDEDLSDSGQLLSNTLQNQMRQAEADLIETLPAGKDCLIIADGPLRSGSTQPQQAVGYIKRLQQPYLEGAEREVLRRLPAGLRTPIFVLDSHEFRRWTWFVRLADPRRGESDFAGLARLEIPADSHLDLADVQRLADLTTRLLPRFAPKPYEDGRAPQNLRPIGALEKKLRHMLGDPKLIRRYIAVHLARLDQQPTNGTARNESPRNREVTLR